jgi:hypothetical protein
MRVIAICTLTLGLALAGCGSGGGGTVASGPVKREAGSWKTDVKLVKLEMPGITPAMKDGMSKMMAGASGQEVCLTPEQAAKEDIANELSKGGSSNGTNCTFSKKDVTGGKINVAGTCKNAGGQTVNLMMTGTMEPKKTDVMMTTTGAAPGGTGNMEMVMQIASTHVGPCKG